MRELKKRIPNLRVAYDDNIQPGDRFPDLLRRMLHEADLVVLVIHQEWTVGGTDDWVRKEIEIAH